VPLHPGAGRDDSRSRADRLAPSRGDVRRADASRSRYRSRGPRLVFPGRFRPVRPHPFRQDLPDRQLRNLGPRGRRPRAASPDTARTRTPPRTRGHGGHHPRQPHHHLRSRPPTLPLRRRRALLDQPHGVQVGCRGRHRPTWRGRPPLPCRSRSVGRGQRLRRVALHGWRPLLDRAEPVPAQPPGQAHPFHTHRNRRNPRPGRQPGRSGIAAGRVRLVSRAGAGGGKRGRPDEVGRVGPGR